MLINVTRSLSANTFRRFFITGSQIPTITQRARHTADQLQALWTRLSRCWNPQVVSVPAPTPNAGRFSRRCDQRYPVIMCQTASSVGIVVAIQNMSTNLFAERLFLVKAHREKKISLLCSRTPRDLTCHERCSSPSAAQRLTLPQPHSTSPDFNHVSPTILHTITLKVNLILLGVTFKGQSVCFEGTHLDWTTNFTTYAKYS